MFILNFRCISLLILLFGSSMLGCRPWLLINLNLFCLFLLGILLFLVLRGLHLSCHCSTVDCFVLIILKTSFPFHTFEDFKWGLTCIRSESLLFGPFKTSSFLQQRSALGSLICYYLTRKFWTKQVPMSAGLVEISHSLLKLVSWVRRIAVLWIGGWLWGQIWKLLLLGWLDADCDWLRAYCSLIFLKFNFI